MLCQFTAKNYKSIRDEVTFDMQAAAISEHEDRIIRGEDGELFLPVSAIYGPNGGGKSNVLEVLHTLVSLACGFGIVTFIFAVLERQHVKVNLKEEKEWSVTLCQVFCSLYCYM